MTARNLFEHFKLIEATCPKILDLPVKVWHDDIGTNDIIMIYNHMGTKTIIIEIDIKE